MAFMGWLLIAVGVLLDLFNCGLSLKGLVKRQPSAIPVVGLVLASGGGWLLSLLGQLPLVNLHQWVLGCVGLHVTFTVGIPLIGLGLLKIIRSSSGEDD